MWTRAGTAADDSTPDLPDEDLVGDNVVEREDAAGDYGAGEP
jgi:hypothetical protein